MDFFKDKHGKLAIWDWPNIPLWGWVSFKLLSVIIKNVHAKYGFSQISKAALITWSYLEITDGKSNFRRVLGAVIMSLTLFSFFR